MIMFGNHQLLIFFVFISAVGTGIAEEVHVEEIPSTYIPRFLNSGGVTEVKIGDTARLRCEIDRKDNVVVMWRKDATFLAIGETTFKFHDDRTNVKEDSTSSELIITNVNTADSGRYVCQISTQPFPLNQTHIVDVQYPPNTIQPIPEIPLVVKRGEDVKLECRADGNPRPNITWSLEGRPVVHSHVSEDTSELSIRDIQPNRAGEYRCFATNNLGAPVEAAIRVEVLFGPIVDVPHKTIKTNAGQQVVLKCKVRGNPHPKIHWTYGGNPVMGHLSHNNDTLTIYQMEQSKAGVYKCKANNNIEDAAEGLIEVHVKYPPEVSVSQDWIHAGEGKTISIICNVKADPVAKVHWMHGHHHLDSTSNTKSETNGDQHTLQIRDFKAKDFGSYTCVASNHLGNNSARAFVTGVPDPVTFNNDQTNVIGNSYNLEFKTMSHSSIIEFLLWYREKEQGEDEDHNMTSSNWRSLIIPPIKSDYIYTQNYTFQNMTSPATYSVIMLANNKYGWSEKSQVFHFSLDSAGTMVALPRDPTHSRFKTEELASTRTTNDIGTTKTAPPIVQANLDSDPGNGSPEPKATSTLRITSLLTIISLITFFL